MLIWWLQVRDPLDVKIFSAVRESHSRVAKGAVRIRGLLYLWYSIRKDGAHPSYFAAFSIPDRSGGGVVDNTLDYQSRGRKIDPPLLRSFG